VNISRLTIFYLTKLKERRRIMSNIYKVIEIIGSSEKSWEELDMRVEKGKVVEYRTKLRVSFKYKP
jgi:flavin-binding protein dodecin